MNLARLFTLALLRLYFWVYCALFGERPISLHTVIDEEYNS